MARTLTKKQRGFVKDYIQTGNGTKSALKNYDTEDYGTAQNIASENLTKPIIVNAIHKALPDELLAEVHEEGLAATFTDKYNTDEPDYATRHKYLDSAYKLKGTYAPEKSLNVNANIEDILTDEDRSLLEVIKEYARNTRAKTDSS